MAKKTDRKTVRAQRSVRSKSKTKRKTPANSESSASQVPQFRAYIAVSLDGYIADTQGGVEWLDAYFTPELHFDKFIKSIGVTVMGRTTYDWTATHGGNESYGRTIVLTHRPLKDAPPHVETFHGDIGKLAGRLRRELKGTGKDIWLIGGGSSISEFHAQGLVDRWELYTIPVLLGDGIPLFPKHTRGLEGLRLTHSHTFKNGIIEAWYEPYAT